MNQAQREIEQAVDAFTQAAHGQVAGGGVDRYAQQFSANLDAIVLRHGANKEVVKTLPNGIQKIRITDSGGELVAEYHQ